MIDPATLLAWPFEPVEHRFDARDCVLYALGIGMGSDPTEPGQLPFVTEEGPVQPVPTMAVVLARPPSVSADPRSGINREMVLHGEQGLRFERPLPRGGILRSRSRITEIADKGAGKGAVIYQDTVIEDDDGPIVHCWSSTFARADGGFGGSATASRKPHKVPDRAPDLSCDLPTFPNQALLYRMNGDLNPLHSDPDAARRAGFDRPILHGLCTYGLVAHAVLRLACDYDPTRLRQLDVRFSSPVFPGETVTVDLWRDGSDIACRARVQARNVTVIDNGHAIVA